MAKITNHLFVIKKFLKLISSKGGAYRITNTFDGETTIEVTADGNDQ